MSTGILFSLCSKRKTIFLEAINHSYLGLEERTARLHELKSRCPANRGRIRGIGFVKTSIVPSAGNGVVFVAARGTEGRQVV